MNFILCGEVAIGDWVHAQKDEEKGFAENLE